MFLLELSKIGKDLNIDAQRFAFHIVGLREKRRKIICTRYLTSSAALRVHKRFSEH